MSLHNSPYSVAAPLSTGTVEKQQSFINFFVVRVCETFWNLHKSEGSVWRQLSDFYVFRPMKEHLRGHKFANDDEVMVAVQSWLKATPKSFFLEGIRKLVDMWTECVAKRGGTVSKNKTQTISVNTLVKNLL